MSTVTTLSLPPLPYADTALAPVISQNTLSFHYGKHHKAYVDNGNKLLAGTELEGRPMGEIIKATYGKSDKTGIFNNVAQVWNHDFYWLSMRPGGGGAPTGRVAELINSSFGGYDAFRVELSNAAMTQFGSGWAWLVSEGGKLKVTKTPNAENPLVHGQTPLLTIDVWEHAYYLDFQNRRADYVAAWLDKLVNWDFAEKNLG
ncbi:MAG: superoxide dismutase [Pseudomonadota bacterium]|nr:superoxide dismutase [Pseudomonadota bacterium]